MPSLASLAVAALLAVLITALPSAPHLGPRQSRLRNARAIYFLTNNEDNAVIAAELGPDGLLTGRASSSLTGGLGASGIDAATNSPAAPDSLFSQSALTVLGDVRFPSPLHLSPILTPGVAPPPRQPRLQHPHLLHHLPNLPPLPHPDPNPPRPPRLLPRNRRRLPPTLPRLRRRHRLPRRRDLRAHRPRHAPARALRHAAAVRGAAEPDGPAKGAGEHGVAGLV